LLKSSGKCLTKEGNKCNFLYSRSKHKSAPLRRRNNFFVNVIHGSYFMSEGDEETGTKWVGNDFQEYRFSTMFFFHSLDDSIWNVDCHFYFDWFNLESPENVPANPFPSLSIHGMKGHTFMMHNLTASCKSLFEHQLSDCCCSLGGISQGENCRVDYKKIIYYRNRWFLKV
jgi:hypothetical protein